ncbi:hypothetical protein [Streptomyces sp. 7N604]|uniref:hypothetical protein n=1 Tax=Streptomyces sp. 7N604 TaxID=3457415 RepID=UPI003FD1F53F
MHRLDVLVRRESGAIPAGLHEDIARMRREMCLLGGETLAVLDDRFFHHILESVPGLRGEAAAWGWDDTAVRSCLASRVAWELLRRRWPKYTQAGLVEAFVGELVEAHRAWCARLEGAEQGRAQEACHRR